LSFSLRCAQQKLTKTAFRFAALSLTKIYWQLFWRIWLRSPARLAWCFEWRQLFFGQAFCFLQSERSERAKKLELKKL